MAFYNRSSVYLKQKSHPWDFCFYENQRFSLVLMRTSVCAEFVDFFFLRAASLLSLVIAASVRQILFPSLKVCFLPFPLNP